MSDNNEHIAKCCMNCRFWAMEDEDRGQCTSEQLHQINSGCKFWPTVFSEDWCESHQEASEEW